MSEYKATTELYSEEQSSELDGEPPEPALRVLVANEQSAVTIDEPQLQAAVRAVFSESPYHAGTVSIALVDDPTIHRVNRQYLDHDYPTDVLSFVLEDQAPTLEGELVVSTDTASRNASEYNWPAQNELLLYVIHGALHLVGYRDKQPEEIAKMRAAEGEHLKALGVAYPTRSTSELSSTGEEPSS